MKTAQEKLIDQIKRHEGEVIKNGRHMPYKCPADKLTLGYGRNIEERGISSSEAEFMLLNDIQDLNHELRTAVVGWTALDDVRRAALVNMAYNLGMPRFKGFKKMLSALAVQDYRTAAAEMLDSKWAKQVGSRAQELAEQIKTGHFE